LELAPKPDYLTSFFGKFRIKIGIVKKHFKNTKSRSLGKKLKIFFKNLISRLKESWVIGGFFFL
jgi:hypothetical protein